jgi:phosphoglycerate dehydrogenase-like enzyme
LLNLVIISRDHQAYQLLFEQHCQRFKQIHLSYCGQQANRAKLASAHIILSEPDLAAEFIDRCSSLKWLQSTWAGNNKLQQHLKRDYVLTGVKGIFAQQMREYVMAYVLYFQRQISSFENLQKNLRWDTLPLSTLDGKTLGIMGLGSIGLEVAKTAQHFGMHIRAITRGSQGLKDVNYYPISRLYEFAKDCDYIVNLLPQTPQTERLCTPLFFTTMKRSSVFINAGRGSIVDHEQTLIDALQNNEILAAVLDVFENEPLSAESKLYTAPNCYITNHTAAISQPDRVFSVFLQNLERFTRQQHLLYTHDFHRGY